MMTSRNNSIQGFIDSAWLRILLAGASLEYPTLTGFPWSLDVTAHSPYGLGIVKVQERWLSRSADGTATCSSTVTWKRRTFE